MTDEELDLQLASLPGIEPPRAVQLAVLGEVGVAPARIAALVPPDARARASRRWWPAAAIGGFALAASLLFAFVGAPPDRADPAQLVPRGSGETIPQLGLRAAVRRGDRTERLEVGRTYAAGDTLMFRVSASTTTDVTFSRDGEVLYRATLGPGETDLPIGYTLEPGQGPARFVLEGGGARATVEIPAVAP